MKIFLKKTGIVLLTLCLATIFMFTSFGASKNEDYDLLLDNGFSAAYIDNLSDEMAEKMAEAIRKKSGIDETNYFDYLLSCGYPKEFLESVTESTLKNIVSLVSEKEILNVDYKTKADVDNSNIIIKSVVAKIKDKETGNITDEVVCVYWEWLDKAPLIKDEDFICVSWDQELFVYGGSFYAEDYYKDEQTDSWVVSNSYKTLARLSLDSLGHWTDLKAFKNVVGGSMVFNLLPTSPIEKENYNDGIEIEYSHRYETLKTIALILIPLVVLAIVLIIVLKKRRKRKKK